LAIQPFTQVIWGRPKLSVLFRVDDTGESEVLHCLISNVPVTNRILKALLVYRNPIDDLVVEFDILTRHNMQKISETFIAKLHT